MRHPLIVAVLAAGLALGGCEEKKKEPLPSPTANPAEAPVESADLARVHADAPGFDWFKGDVATVQRMAANGYYISFTPDIVYEEEIQALAAKAPGAVRATKALMKRGEEPIAERMRAESVHFAAQLQSPELREAIKAFTEKRAPDFSKVS